MPTEEQQAAFGEALRRLMKANGISQRELGEIVGEEIRGAGQPPYKQSTVRDWIEKSAPDPEIVFFIEGFLLQPPGTLSQLLGYLPTAARSVTTVEEAIMIDTSIGGVERDILVLLYGVFADKPLRNATIGQFTLEALDKVVRSARANTDLLDLNRMKFDAKGRLIDGFDVAPPRVIMLAIPEWEREPSLPMPKALLDAARAHREKAAAYGFEDLIQQWDELLAPYAQPDPPSMEQFARRPGEVDPVEAAYEELAEPNRRRRASRRRTP